MEPHDRRRDEPAGQGHRGDVGEALWDGIALGHPAQARDEQEDGGDRGERQLRAGLEQRGGRPDEEHEPAQREEVPPVAWTRGEPRQRRECPCHTRSYDRGLPADGEHVGPDSEQRSDMADRTRQARQPGGEEHAADHEGDVLPGNRHQVV